MAKQSYTGHTRQRKTSRWVRFAEVLSRWLITVGGIGTIVAVVTVFVFLLVVVIPLFRPPSVTQVTEQPLARVNWSAEMPLRMEVDEDQVMGWALLPSGRLQVFELKTGKILSDNELFDKPPTKTAFSIVHSTDPKSTKPNERQAVFGFADGSTCSAQIEFSSDEIESEKLPDELRGLRPGQAAPWNDTMVIVTPQRDFRQLSVIESKTLKRRDLPKSAIRLVAQSVLEDATVTAAFSEEGKLWLVHETKPRSKSFVGKRKKKEVHPEQLDEWLKSKGPPHYLFLSAFGNQVILLWKDGQMVRIDARNWDKIQVAETANVLNDPALEVTKVEYMLGDYTLLVGDSSGRVRAWFFAMSKEAATVDGGRMVCAHEFAATGSPVNSLAVSKRTRIAAATHADGRIRLFCVTSDYTMADLETGRAVGVTPPCVLALAPKDDGLFAAGQTSLLRWKIEHGHPEITAQTLFGKVWYEGYDKPERIWQSGESDVNEPKFSFVPLIFGTLKAALFSLLFGMPLALLAAIYTSEFMHPRAKAIVKPTIELMASLPSVALGFLAGLVFAQFVEKVLSTVIVSMLTVPLAFVLGGYLWQLLPERIALKLMRSRFLFISLMLPLGLGGAMLLGPVMEDLLFNGNLRTWVNASAEGNTVRMGKDGDSGVGGWILLFIPVGAVLSTILMGKFVNPWLRHVSLGWSRGVVSFLALGKWLAGCSLALAVACVAAVFLDLCGFDPRSSLMLGAYSQRNTLVVSIFMGFAIIPIIYTIAEDALSSVPEHLRAGSLATGATQWQTATRIVVPTAMSGLFSAMMIGLGRAVGETMIVLMGTGNTPVTDWSLFTGFRTLSANIATELGEAAVLGTHYRTLFLSALILFAMTFVVNSIAEAVRIRFRRRAYQL